MIKNTFYLYFFLLFISISGCSINDPEPSDQRKIFLGTYDVEQENLRSGWVTHYTIKIIASPDDPDLILIENFYDAGKVIYAEYSGSIIRIPEQVSGFNMFEGRLTYNNRTLNMDFVVKDSDEKGTYYNEYLAVGTKR